MSRFIESFINEQSISRLRLRLSSRLESIERVEREINFREMIERESIEIQRIDYSEDAIRERISSEKISRENRLKRIFEIEDEKTDDRSLQCVLCLENKRNIAPLCGHFISCNTCSQDILTKGNKKCPICRKAWKNLRVIYI